MLSPKIKIRIVLWSILALAVLWFVWQAIVPSGQISYRQDFSEDSFFISNFIPEDRVSGGEEADTRRIIGDPVYFNLNTPRRFNTARLFIKYKKEVELPIIEAGVMTDKDLWLYDLEPLSNSIVDQLSLVWDVVGNVGVTLLQREKKFTSVEEFLENTPTSTEIAVYNYDLRTDFVLENYEAYPEPGSGYPEPGSNTFHALQGTYQFYTYIKDEELGFNFTVRDLNKNADSDPVEIRLYYRGEVIDSRSWEDDGIADDKGQESAERSFEFKAINLPEGVYKIEIRVNDDIITTGIKTKQSKLAFINKLKLFRDEGKDISLYTDSRKIQATTIYPDRLGTLKLGENELKLEKTYAQYSGKVKRASSTDAYAKILLPRGGIILSGEGTFSFSPEAWFNPRLKRVDENLDINADGINYILTRYRLPERDGDWLISTAEYNLKYAYREKGGYSFIVSIPGLRADDEVEDYVEIGEVRVELEGRSLFDKVKGMMNL